MLVPQRTAAARAAPKIHASAPSQESKENEGYDDDDDRAATATTPVHNTQLSSAAPTSAALPWAPLPPDWDAGAAAKAGDTVAWERRGKAKSRPLSAAAGISDARIARLHANWRAQASAALAQRVCTGTEVGGVHTGGCTSQPFTVAEFQGGAIEFAHWAKYSGHHDTDYIKGQLARLGTPEFVTWMAERGRFLRHACHLHETHKTSKDFHSLAQ
jgi:hypothetical protein